MNKKFFIKIIISIFSICFLLCSLYSFFSYLFNQITYIKKYLILIDDAKYKNQQNTYFLRILFQYFFVLLASIILFLVINFKDLKFLTESLIEKFVSWRKDTEEERKENKQAKLKREIAEKQAVLEIRSHVAWYLKGLKGANEVKNNIYKVKTIEEIKKILQDFKNMC